MYVSKASAVNEATLTQSEHGGLQGHLSHERERMRMRERGRETETEGQKARERERERQLQCIVRQRPFISSLAFNQMSLILRNYNGWILEKKSTKHARTKAQNHFFCLSIPSCLHTNGNQAHRQTNRQTKTHTCVCKHTHVRAHTNGMSTLI